MTILSAQSILTRWANSDIRHSCFGEVADFIIDPFEKYAQQAFGMSYGLTAAGYDIRIGELSETPGVKCKRLERNDFMLCASLERIRVPNDLQVIVHDKSSWARQGLAIQNTVLEPGWEGYITLELSNHGKESLVFHTGQPIAQLVFHQLDEPTHRPYRGKYQDQGPEPVRSIHEETKDD